MRYDNEYKVQSKKSEAADKAWRQWRNYSEILIYSPFIIGANLTLYGCNFSTETQEIYPHKETPIKFFTHGFTKIDIIAEMMALNAYLLLKMLLIDPILACGTKLIRYLEAKKPWSHALFKIISGVVFSGVLVAAIASTAATYLSWFALKIALRTVSTVLGLIAAPINYAYNLINDADESKTYKQDYLLGSGIFIGLAGIALAAATFGGLMTPAVLGTSAFALALISIAWPLAIGTAAAGVAVMAGVGLYKLFNHCCGDHKNKHKLDYDSSEDKFEPLPFDSSTACNPDAAPGPSIL